MGLLESATQAGELASLGLILLTLLVLLVAGAKAKTPKSFQFQMLVVAVILFSAEIPRMLSTLGLLDLSSMEDLGLEIHSLSMVVLVGFVAYRTYGFMKKE